MSHTLHFRHNRLGCSTVLISYIGKTPLTRGTVLRREDWLMPDGFHPERLTQAALYCPDCDKVIPFQPGILTAEPASTVKRSGAAIVANPVRKIADLVASNPVKLVPILDGLLPRKKGKVQANIANLPKPEILKILAALERAA